MIGTGERRRHRINHVEITTNLKQLLDQRRHGAATIAAFRFQLLYSLDRLLDLVSDENLVTGIQLEGFEDVDIWCYDTKAFIQVKSSKEKQGWSWLNKKRILDNFAEVYRLDKTARFQLVTNFQFIGDLKSLYLFAEEGETTLPKELTRHLSPMGKRLNLTPTEVEGLFKSIRFEITDRTSLVQSIRQKLISRFEIHTRNEDLYFRALSSKVDDLASRRSTWRAEDIHRFVLEIQDWINAGATNPAVKYGWIEPLRFESDPQGNEEDYYLGKGARPGHILADVDAHRPEWLKEIRDSLSDTPVCIVRSSSGQGKSTLLYRYAYMYFDDHTRFVLKKIQDPDEIVPLRRFLESRLQLDLPVLVLVNDLNERVKLWHELAREFAGRPILFLLASREENWHRYAGNLHNLQWKTVKPELSIREAKDIYRQFKKRGRIADNVKSAAWAYDKVATEKLLIEFVFLITHGQMLSERLEDQVRTIYSLEEDSAKLDVLRLVSLAQNFDVRIPLERLYTRVEFQSDKQQAVVSLTGEYLDVTEDEYLEGLHYVRSEHLVKILHEAYPVNITAAKLFDLVDDDDLPVLARSAFSSINTWVHAEPLLNRLFDRTSGRVALTLEVLQALFRGDERRYILINQDAIEDFKRIFGSAELSTFFVNGTMPLSSGLDIIHEVRELFSNEQLEQKLNLMQAEIRRMPDRMPEDQFARGYVTKALRRLAADDLSANLSAVSNLRTWSQMYDQPFEILSAFVDSGNWENHVFTKPIDEFADFMRLLYRNFPSAHRKFIDRHWLKTVNHFRVETETLKVVARGDNIHIEFIVDETRDVHDEQTLSRLRTLIKLLPQYETYTSQGLYPVSPINRLTVDDSQKNLTKESLDMEIAEINSRYIVELETFVNPDSMYDWLEYWHTFRITLSAYVVALAKRYENILKKKAVVDLQPLLDELSPLLDVTPGLPALYKDVFEQQAKDMRDWKSWLNNFVSKYLKVHYTERSSEETRLYRHNLAEVCGRLKRMQDAYQTILDSRVSHFQSTIKNRNEEKNYRDLYDLMNYFVSIPESRAIPRGARAKAMVSAWRKSHWREVNTRLREVFQSAADNGLKVHLPNGYLEELPTRNLCFAVEIIDATQIDEHLGAFIASLHAAAVAYDYVYVLPVVECRPLQRNVYQIYSETVSKIAAGEQLDDKIAIWQIEMPGGFFQSVNSIYREVLPEWHYYVDAQSILYRLHGLRNEVAYISQRVEDELLAWRTLLFDAIEQRLNAVESDANQLIKSATRLQVQAAPKRWDLLWSYFDERVKSQKESTFEVVDFDPVAPDQDVHLMLAFGNYVNYEYLYKNSK